MVNLVFPAKHPESKLPAQEVVDWFQKNLLRDPDRLVVGQNIPFDLARINRASTRGPQAILCLADDSMVYHFILSEKSPNRSLRFLVETYTDLGRYKDEVDVLKLRETDLKKVARYNGVDAYAPLVVIESLQERLKEEGIYDQRAIELFRRMVPYVTTMSSVGFKVDRAKLAQVEKKLSAKLAFTEGILQRETGINPYSTPQLAQYLFSEEGLGLPVPQIKDCYGKVAAPYRTRAKGVDWHKTNVPSTREDVLERIDHPLVEKILSMRGDKKLLSTYVRGKRGKSIWENLTEDDYVYPDYFLIKHHRGGSVSRLSVKNPAMQTLGDSEVKACFVSRYEDGILLEFDWKQMELRYGACMSKDPALIEALKGDPHAATAGHAGLDRDGGKTANFLLVYGGTIAALEEKLGVPRGKAAQVYRLIHEAYPVFFKYLEDAKREAVMNGRVFTPYGMHLTVPGATPSTGQGRAILREAANYVIQRPASDMAQLFGWYMMHRLDGLALPVMSNHDGLTWDLRRDDLPQVLDNLRAGLVYFPRLVDEILGIDITAVTFEVDVKIGTNWLEMEEIETD